MSDIPKDYFFRVTQRLGKKTIYGWTLGGCPEIAIFPKIKACEKNYRRHMLDIPRIIF